MLKTAPICQNQGGDAKHKTEEFSQRLRLQDLYDHFCNAYAYMLSPRHVIRSLVSPACQLVQDSNIQSVRDTEGVEINARSTASFTVRQKC